MASPFLEAKFPFLHEDIFLIAQVETETGKQTLRMQKIDPKTGNVLLEDTLDCIHTAICNIPVDKFAEITRRDDFEESILHIRSSEQLQEVKLAPDEKFLAFRSWVAGIAEAGMNAFEIQGEIDAAAQLQYPVTNRILRFLARVDFGFISTYLDYVDHTATHEGVRHRAYIVASLLPILEGLIQIPRIPNGAQVLQMIFALDPPFELFNNSWPLFRRLAENYPNFLTQYLSRVHEEHQKNRGGGDEWLSVVLCPVLDAFVWTGELNLEERENLWVQIRTLDPPPMLFSAYGTLFRYFVLKDPGFLPQYMRRIKRDRAGLRVNDNTWLITVLRPVFVVLDFITDQTSSGCDDLWHDILALDPPVEFLIENWKILLKLASSDSKILSDYVKWIRQHSCGAKAGDRAWLITATRPAINTWLSLKNMQSHELEKIRREIVALEPPLELLPSEWKK